MMRASHDLGLWLPLYRLVSVRHNFETLLYGINTLSALRPLCRRLPVDCITLAAVISSCTSLAQFFHSQRQSTDPDAAPYYNERLVLIYFVNEGEVRLPPLDILSFPLGDHEIEYKTNRCEECKPIIRSHCWEESQFCHQDRFES